MTFWRISSGPDGRNRPIIPAVRTRFVFAMSFIFLSCCCISKNGTKDQMGLSGTSLLSSIDEINSKTTKIVNSISTYDKWSMRLQWINDIVKSLGYYTVLFLVLVLLAPYILGKIAWISTAKLFRSVKRRKKDK